MSQFEPDFLLIPRIITKDQDIPPAGGYTYGAIYLYAQLNEGKCKASNKKIANIACIESGTVSNMISKLRSEGYIRCNYKTSKKRIRKSIEPLVKYQKVKGGSSNDETGVHQTMERVPSNDEQNNNYNNNSNNIKTGASSTGFSLEEKLEKMSNDNKRHIQIISIWMEERGLQPKNKKQYQQIIKRYLRPAKRLEGYSNEEIRKTIDYVSNVDHIDKPSLETVEKYIDDLIAGNLKGRKPKTWEY